MKHVALQLEQKYTWYRFALTLLKLHELMIFTRISLPSSTLLSWFSWNLFNLLPLDGIFKAKMHQIRFWLGIRPWPRHGSLQRSPGPVAGFQGPTSKGKKEKGKLYKRETADSKVTCTRCISTGVLFHTQTFVSLRLYSSPAQVSSNMAALTVVNRMTSLSPRV